MRHRTACLGASQQGAGATMRESAARHEETLDRACSVERWSNLGSSAQP